MCPLSNLETSEFKFLFSSDDKSKHPKFTGSPKVTRPAQMVRTTTWSLWTRRSRRAIHLLHLQSQLPRRQSLGLGSPTLAVLGAPCRCCIQRENISLCFCPFCPFCPFALFALLPFCSFCPYVMLSSTFWELFLLSIVSLHFYHLNFHFWAFILSENHSVMKVLSFCEGIDVGCGEHDFVWNDRLHRLIPPPLLS